ncbi:MAG: carbohydrate ABC transporter permease [Fimbriimonadaceae bacterium]|nr:carbohydrate ABC transporter permease [Fimbriimonadaceae bacterium]
MIAWWRRHDLGTHLLLLPLGLLMAAPFLWMLGTSLKTFEETTNLWPWPAVPQWQNYAEAWRAAPFGRYFLVSTVTAAAVTASVVLTGLLGGYSFGALRWRGQQTVLGVYLATMMVPFEVILIPNYLIVQKLHWIDRFPALIVPWAANVFSVFLVTQAFRSLPKDFREAAMLDGCGHWQYLWRIAAPLVAPSLATAAIFAFLGSWNSLLWPVIVLNSERMRTVEMGLSSFLQEEGASLHLLMAGSVVALLPVLLVFLAMQRRFIEGLAAGLKG